MADLGSDSRHVVGASERSGGAAADADGDINALDPPSFAIAGRLRLVRSDAGEPVAAAGVAATPTPTL